MLRQTPHMSSLFNYLNYLNLTFKLCNTIYESYWLTINDRFRVLGCVLVRLWGGWKKVHAKLDNWGKVRIGNIILYIGYLHTCCHSEEEGDENKG